MAPRTGSGSSQALYLSLAGLVALLLTGALAFWLGRRQARDSMRMPACRRCPAPPAMTRKTSTVLPRMIEAPIGRPRSARPEVGATGRGLHVNHTNPALRIEGNAFA